MKNTTGGGRETETSSDASDEAPERARKDTPEEARLLLTRQCLSCASLQVKFLRLSRDASHVRRDGGHAGCVTFPAREI